MPSSIPIRDVAHLQVATIDGLTIATLVVSLICVRFRLWFLTRSDAHAVSALRNIRIRVREDSVWIPLPDPRVQSPQVEIQIVVPDIAIAEKSLRNRETIGHGIFDRYKPTPSVRGGRIDQDLGVFQIERLVKKPRIEVMVSLSRHKQV